MNKAQIDEIKNYMESARNDAEGIAGGLSEILDIISKEEEQQHHWFTSSLANYVLDEDLGVCMRKQIREDKGNGLGGFNVFRVPLPLSAEYDIRLYQPVVDDLLYVGLHSYRKDEDQSCEE